MNILLSTIVFIYGAIVGSFLNVVSLRLPTDRDIIKKPSHCPYCKHRLGFFDLVPIVSYVILSGSCRYCKKQISPQYIAVETLTGFIFVLVGLVLSLELNIFSPIYIHALFAWIVLSAFMVITLIDIRHFIIPDSILIFLIIVTALYAIGINYFGITAPSVFGNPLFLEQVLGYDMNSVLELMSRLIGSAVAGGFIWFLWFITRGKGMGFGDVKLAAALGLILGWTGAVEALGIAFISGSVVGIVMVMMQGKNLKTMIPFGPFLVFGAAVSLLT